MIDLWFLLNNIDGILIENCWQKQQQENFWFSTSLVRLVPRTKFENQSAVSSAEWTRDGLREKTSSKRRTTLASECRRQAARTPGSLVRWPKQDDQSRFDEPFKDTRTWWGGKCKTSPTRSCWVLVETVWLKSTSTINQQDTMKNTRENQINKRLSSLLSNVLNEYVRDQSETRSVWPTYPHRFVDESELGD